MTKRTSDCDTDSDAPRKHTAPMDEDDRPLTVLAALAADPESRLAGLWRDVRQYVLAPMLVPTLATGKYTRVRHHVIPSMAGWDNGRSCARQAALGHSHYFFALTDSNVLAVSRADPSVVCWYWVSPYRHCGLAALPDGGVAALDQDGVIYLCPAPRADGAANMSIRDPERREHEGFFMGGFGGLQATRHDVPRIRTGSACGETTKFAVSPDGNTFWIASCKAPKTPCRALDDDTDPDRRMRLRAYDRTGACVYTHAWHFTELSGLVVTAREVCVAECIGRAMIQPLAPGASAVIIHTKSAYPCADGHGNLVAWGVQPYLEANEVYSTGSGALVRTIWYPTDALPHSAYAFDRYDAATGSLFSLHVEGLERGTIYELY